MTRGWQTPVDVRERNLATDFGVDGPGRGGIGAWKGVDVDVAAGRCCRVFHKIGEV